MIDFEATIRRLIDDGNEFDKVDFKSTFPLEDRIGKAKLAKLVSAIANTDGEQLDNYGYVILGAERRRICGGMDRLNDDNFCAELARGINAYLDPPVPLQIKGYKDRSAGWFGAIVIPPRFGVTGPHFMKKQFNQGDFAIRPVSVLSG